MAGALGAGHGARQPHLARRPGVVGSGAEHALAVPPPACRHSGAPVQPGTGAAARWQRLAARVRRRSHHRTLRSGGAGTAAAAGGDVAAAAPGRLGATGPRAVDAAVLDADGGVGASASCRLGAGPANARAVVFDHAQRIQAGAGRGTGWRALGRTRHGAVEPDPPRGRRRRCSGLAADSAGRGDRPSGAVAAGPRAPLALCLGAARHRQRARALLVGPFARPGRVRRRAGRRRCRRRLDVRAGAGWGPARQRARRSAPSGSPLCRLSPGAISGTSPRRQALGASTSPLPGLYNEKSTP